MNSITSVPDYSHFMKTTATGLNEIYLTVTGIHCAACIQKIESTLQANHAIKKVRLNFSTGRLQIVWQGDISLGNQWIQTVLDLGYDAKPFNASNSTSSDERENRFLLLSLGIAGFAAGNIMLISAILWTTTQKSLSVEVRDFLHLISALIAIPAVAFGGRPFFRSALTVLKKRRTNMDVPISLALILCTATSVYEMFHHGEHAYFDSTVMLMFFLLIGRYLDFRARARARSSAQDILSLMQKNATIIDNGIISVVPSSQLKEGMTVLVAIGERIPADGIITEGTSELDASLLTGETIPQTVKPNDSVFSGSLNMAAPLKIQVQRAAEHSFVADVIRLMENAEQANASYVRLADRVARLYTPVVHILALATFIGWMLFSNLPWEKCLMIAVTVLIITCPCALALAVPVVQVLTVGRLMRRGILIKSGDALERFAVIHRVLFDKTGTLTLGYPSPINLGERTKEETALAASMAAHSRHPLSMALAKNYQGPLLQMTIHEFPGKGLQTELNGQVVKLGSRSWCGAEDQGMHADYLELWLAVAGQNPVPFYFHDSLRSDADETIKKLAKKGLSVTLLSGDRVEAVNLVAKQLGINDWHGAMTPQDKYNYLQKCQQTEKILMVGDGLNDAPVLRAANVSMSPATAIDIAQNSADIVFMGQGLQAVALTFDAAQFSQRLVWQNFALTVAYNLLAIPMAIMGHVTPLIAAIAMSSSSLVVVANSFRMRFKI